MWTHAMICRMWFGPVTDSATGSVTPLAERSYDGTYVPPPG